jgi:hypothetical protein
MTVFSAPSLLLWPTNAPINLSNHNLNSIVACARRACFCKRNWLTGSQSAVFDVKTPAGQIREGITARMSLLEVSS